jgi:sugar/nucleoside kinase (ribokinase family)
MFDVVVIGTGTRDVFLRSNKIKTVHDAKHFTRLGFPGGVAECLPYGAKIEIEAPIMVAGGGATNAGVTFARHGLRTAAAVKIGKDEGGREVEAVLKKEKVKAYPLHDKEQGTAWSAIILAHGGERTILTHRGASVDLDANDVPVGKLKAKWAYLVPGHVPMKEMVVLARKFKAQGTRIMMNPSQAYVRTGLKGMAPLLELLDIVLVNREEAAALAEVPTKDLRQIFDKIDQYASGLVVITDGAKGVLVADHPHLKVYRAGIFKEKTLADRTGSGDAFGSGFLASLIDADWRGEDNEGAIKEAIRFASANATAVVEEIGAQKGILTKAKYKKENRFRRLHVQVTHT